MESDLTGEYIQRLPKAELHLHLEGSITPAIFRELSQKYKTEYQSVDEDELRRCLFQYRDFAGFLETYRTVCEHLQEPADYLKILEQLGEYFSRQNIVYAEIIYSPAIPWKFGRDGKEVLVALLEKSREIRANHGTIIRWILDCVRKFGPELAQQTAELAADLRQEGVVGLGLGGDEQSLEMKTYEEIFAWARAHELFIHAHAGEIGDPQQVWDALLVLGANRVGHGIQAARDPRLMDYLREHAIGLDVCLTSNCKTGAWRPISDNPFGLLYKRGVPVTLNSDDPGLFETSLIEEFQKAIHSFKLSRDDVHRIVLQGARAAFLPHNEKTALINRFQQQIHSLPS